MTQPRMASCAFQRTHAIPRLLLPLTLAVVLGALAPRAAAIPTLAEVRAAHRTSDITLLDRHGTPVQTMRIDPTVRRLPWVHLQDLSPALLQAVVQSEDQRFWQHNGVDWQAVAKSAWANTLNKKTRGASTLTMQLAGLLDEGLARPAGGRSVVQKIGQAATALQLETRWSKSDIIEAYLNVVPLRGEMVGINALAQTLFNKHPSGLDDQEAAIAAALVRAPNASAARVAERACALLRLQPPTAASCSAVQDLAEAALARNGGMPLGEHLAPHFGRLVVREQGLAMRSGASTDALRSSASTDALRSGAAVNSQRSGAASNTLRTTLSAPLQRAALAALREQLAALQGRNVEDGAIVVLDNASGEVLAWVGSSGSATSDAPEVDAVLARRQPGSTLKPFVYALAFERRLITPATLLHDTPTQLATGAGLYLPQNYDRDYRGWVSARTALGASLNVPAVRVAALLPPDALFDQLNRFGLALPHNGGYYGHALALGGADVTLLALTNAYRGLANGGLLSAPVWVPQGVPQNIPQSAPPHRAALHPVASAAAVDLVTRILSDNNARATTFGLHSALATRGFAAVKTGTSKDLRDNWCVGYTSRYTVGVWMGNAGGEPMHRVSGISGAAPVWRALVQHLHRGQPSSPPAAVAGVTTRRIAFEGATEAPRQEWFIAGSEQVLNRAGTQLAQGRSQGITSPQDGSLFALDPDIPLASQRITLQGEAGTWLVDGRPVGQGKLVRWLPTPGRHRISLVDVRGRVVQQLRVEVRGLVSSAASLQ